ncbi:MAG: glycosyltransferase family 39 protein, partial [Candidatus Gottesmanbacteria bacterium]
MKRIFGLVIRFLPIISICCLAAYLRLYKISAYMTFLGDEGRDVLVVKQMIVDGKFTLLGPTASVGGFFMGPIYYYFMTPFLWAWNLNPVGPAIMVALFGIATVLLIWKFGSDVFSKRIGLMAALLYTLSPVVISFSRSSWNPNIVPFFSLLMVYFLWRVIQRGEWKKLFWVGVCAGIGIQLHYTFLFLFGVVGVLMLIYGRSVKKLPYMGLGMLGFIIGFSPFLAFEFRHAFMNTRAILDFVFAGKDTGFAA